MQLNNNQLKLKKKTFLCQSDMNERTMYIIKNNWSQLQNSLKNKFSSTEQLSKDATQKG